MSTAYDLNNKIFSLQAQSDAQTGELIQTKEEYKISLENEKVLLNEIEKIKETVFTSKVDGITKDVKNRYQSSLEKLTNLINEIIA